MKHWRNWAIGILLTAAAAAATVRTVSAPTHEEVDSVQTVPPTAESFVAPTEEPSTGNCAYTWATHDAPELTQGLDSAVKAINSQASANASFYGEDCVYQDGHSTFSAMETDFYIHLPADDLTAKEDFGNWMAQVMEIITQFPRENLKGNYGFVEFWFEKNENEHVIARVPIQEYLDQARGKSGAELFDLFAQP